VIEFHFRLIVSGPFSEPLSDDELLDATDALGEVGCDDCSISVCDRGLELEFYRAHLSLQDAIASAINDVEKAGYVVELIQMDRDAAIPVAAQPNA
jgi:hypothetical protein